MLISNLRKKNYFFSLIISSKKLQCHEIMRWIMILETFECDCASLKAADVFFFWICWRSRQSYFFDVISKTRSDDWRIFSSSEKTRFSPAITFHVESGEDKILLSHKFAFIWQTNYRCTLYGDAVNLWRLCCVVREWDTREWIYDSFRMTSQLVELIVYWRSLALPSQRKKHAVRNWRRR